MSDRESKIKGFQGVVFGIVDGLIAMIGTTFAISAISQNPFYVLAAGIAVGLSNGIANAAGFYLSEEVESEHLIANHTKGDIRKTAILCFLGAILAVILPLLPYLFLGFNLARIVSFFIAALILFVLGYYHATVSQEPKVREGLKFVIISAVAAIICYGLGIIMNRFIII